MAALITLTAVPGHIERHAGYGTKTVEIRGRELGRITRPVATIAQRSPGDGVDGPSTASLCQSAGCWNPRRRSRPR